MPTSMNRTVAGLPVWAWAGIIAVGVGIGLYLRSRNTSDTALAADDTAGADSGANVDANGNPMDGTASGDTADTPGMGELPGQAWTGFQGGSPPAYPPPTARMDPKLMHELRQLIKEERAEDKKHGHKPKRGTGHSPPILKKKRRRTTAHDHASLTGGGALAPGARTTTTHYPA